MGYFDDNKIERLISEAVSLASVIQDKNKVLEDCFRHIKKDNLKETLNEIQDKIRKAETASDTDRVNKLIVEYNELIKGLNHIRPNHQAFTKLKG